MNKTLLILNALILVTNFFLSWASTNSQLSVLETTARLGSGSTLGARSQGDPYAVTYLRLMQSLEGMMSKDRVDKFTPDQVRGIHAAIAAYENYIQAGVAGVLYDREPPSVPMHKRHEELSRGAREDLESRLRSVFQDDTVIRQVATAIIGQVR